MPTCMFLTETTQGVGGMSVYFKATRRSVSNHTPVLVD